MHEAVKIFSEDQKTKNPKDSDKTLGDIIQEIMAKDDDFAPYINKARLAISLRRSEKGL